jgi:hypothetical protein
MAFFRRLKSCKSKKSPGGGIKKMLSPNNKSDNVLPVETKKQEESVGELLSPKDQFDLEIPMKHTQPIGILRIQSEDVMKSRRCMRLQGQNITPVKTPEFNDVDHNSTVSSLSGVSPDFAPVAMKTGPSNAPPATHKNKSVPVIKVLGNKIRLEGSCCGMTAHTEDTDDSNSIAASQNEKRRKAAHDTGTWLLCGGGRGPEEIAEIVKEPVSSPVNRKSPQFLRDTSLFDTLADEVEDAETNVALAEENTLASVTSTKRSKTSKTSRFRLPKTRSFKKVKSYLKGKAKEESDAQAAQR